MLSNIRKDSISGIIELERLVKVDLHFSEWWNGEGLDFKLNEDQNISLHCDEIHAMMVAAVAAGYIDPKEVAIDAKKLLRESKEREQLLKVIRGDYEL